MKKELDNKVWEELSSSYGDYNIFEDMGIEEIKDDDISNYNEKELFQIKDFVPQVNEKISDIKYSYWKSVAKSVFSSYSFIICLVLLVAIVLLAIIVPFGKDAGSDIITNKPEKDFIPAAPSWKHPFGLGVYGDDYWLQIWYGTRQTLLFTLIIATIQITLGILLGCIWGYYRKIDIYFIEFTRLLNIIPTIILWFVVIFVFNSYTIGVIVFAVSITSWITLADVIRTQIILVKNSEYNIASHTLGTSGVNILRRNIFPKILPVVTQTASYSVPLAISIDATLAYYGFGFVQSTTLVRASLGSILQQIFQDNFWISYPHLIVFPTIFIAGISALFFIMGKVFADSLDQKNHN